MFAEVNFISRQYLLCVCAIQLIILQINEETKEAVLPYFCPVASLVSSFICNIIS